MVTNTPVSMPSKSSTADKKFRWWWSICALWGKKRGKKQEELPAGREASLRDACLADAGLERTCEDTDTQEQAALTSVRKNGMALRHVSNQLQGNQQIVLEAVGQHGFALQHASSALQADKKIVMAAVARHGFAIQFASLDLQGEEEVAEAAVANAGLALEYVADSQKACRRVVLAAVRQNGNALQHASPSLRADKEVVLAAVTNRPDAIKFARDGLNQDPECWVAAKLWDEHQLEQRNSNSGQKITLSTRFSLNEESTSSATNFTLSLMAHPYICSGNFYVYSPNAFNKGTCDPEWTRMEWPCRGTFDTCKMDDEFKTGAPNDGCCWRYSFRCHLEESKQSGGFMVQVVDYDKNAGKHILGKGQEIETVMAQDVGAKVFRIFAPVDAIHYFPKKDIEELVSCIKLWYSENRADMTVCDVQVGSYDDERRLLGNYLDSIKAGGAVVPRTVALSTRVASGEEETLSSAAVLKRILAADSYFRDGNFAFHSPASQYDLEKARETWSFMVQVVDYNRQAGKYVLAENQEVDAAMAKKVGVKIFRMLAPIGGVRLVPAADIDALVTAVKEWYKIACVDAQLCEVNCRDCNVWVRAKSSHEVTGLPFSRRQEQFQLVPKT